MTSDLLSVAHVVMAQATQGSTLTAVAERLGEAQERAGGAAVVLLPPGVSTEQVPCLVVPYGRRHFTQEEVVTDWADGWRGRLRRNYGHVYDPAVACLTEQPPDVVLLYDGHYAAASLPRWEPVRQAGSRVCLYVHNPLSRSYQRRELRRLLGHADRVVFCAEHLRDATGKRLGARWRGAPLDVVHNGVDDVFRATGPRAPDDGELVVLFVGRLVENKGAHLVIEAAELASRRLGRDVRVRVLGAARAGVSGPYPASLRDLAGTVRVPVELLPAADRREVARQMRAASVVCLPSTWAEGFPLVVLEAMASGTPVVCSDAPGMVEASGGVARLAPRGDVAGLVDGLCALATDPAEWAERSEAGRARAASFTWDEAARALAGPPAGG